MKNCCNNPCTGCSRVPYPAECENLHCHLWRRWFITRWEEMRKSVRQQMDQAQTAPMGVPLGGNYYTPPHKIREYRAQNPCENCTIRPLCKEKCNIRKLWEQQGGIQ